MAEDEAAYAAAMAEELARLGVADVLVQSATLLATVAQVKLGHGPHGDAGRDLPESRKAIDALSRLTDILSDVLTAEEVAQVRQSIAALQMAYADEVKRQEAPRSPDEPGAPGAPEQGAPPAPEVPDRPPIWTPRGDV